MGKITTEEKIILDKIREEIAENFAYLVIVEHMTIRQVAAKYGSSKSMVHHYLRTYLRDPNLIEKVDAELAEHFKLKHIRGGEATRLKYASMVKM